METFLCLCRLPTFNESILFLLFSDVTATPIAYVLPNRCDVLVDKELSSRTYHPTVAPVRSTPAFIFHTNAGEYEPPTKGKFYDMNHFVPLARFVDEGEEGGRQLPPIAAPVDPPAYWSGHGDGMLTSRLEHVRGEPRLADLRIRDSSDLRFEPSIDAATAATETETYYAKPLKQKPVFVDLTSESVGPEVGVEVHVSHSKPKAKVEERKVSDTGYYKFGRMNWRFSKNEPPRPPMDNDTTDIVRGKDLQERAVGALLQMADVMYSEPKTQRTTNFGPKVPGAVPLTWPTNGTLLTREQASKVSSTLDGLYSQYNGRDLPNLRALMRAQIQELYTSIPQPRYCLPDPNQELSCMSQDIDEAAQLFLDEPGNIIRPQSMVHGEVEMGFCVGYFSKSGLDAQPVHRTMCHTENFAAIPRSHFGLGACSTG